MNSARNAPRPVRTLSKQADSLAESRAVRCVLEERQNSVSTGRTIEDMVRDWTRDAARLKTIEDTLRRRSAEGEVFAYFKHDEEPTGAIYAIETLRKLQQ
jgi:hypothetical protein